LHSLAVIATGDPAKGMAEAEIAILRSTKYDNR
jgi:hypothetical protein